MCKRYGKCFIIDALHLLLSLFSCTAWQVSVSECLVDQIPPIMTAIRIWPNRIQDEIQSIGQRDALAVVEVVITHFPRVIAIGGGGIIATDAFHGA